MPPSSELPADPRELLHLDRQLCFLLYQASGRMTQIYRPILEPLGLTYPQYLVMLALWQHGDQSVSALGKRLDMEIGTLSPLLKRMEAAGHLVRRRDDADERRVIIRLTQQGRNLRRSALKAVPPALACQLTMPLEELLALHHGLSRLVHALEPKG